MPMSSSACSTLTTAMIHSGMLSDWRSGMWSPRYADQRPCAAPPVISFSDRQPSLAAVFALSTVPRTFASSRTKSSSFGSICVRMRAPRAGLAAVLDLVLLHLAVERRAVEAEDLGRLLLVPVRPLECLQDGHLLNLGKRAVWRADEFGRRRALGGGGF